ncbi:MAG: hypothetical protein H0A75_04555 [Candidatus Methanofishera endochildressiae]|uniref:DUF11 domain-containing protein n=1 Tax=Candidatus Methanofishera endochildressiae TaxID=2738884 RepID=A0A7Z0MNK2_9GAMM|nr:hypothetical protein [Candidatus Methanofishera endochildressiae]
MTTDSPLPAGQSSVTNTASISDGGINGADPTPDNNISTVITALVLQPPVGSKQGEYQSASRSIVWEMIWFNPNNDVPLPVLILDEIPSGLKFSDVQCAAEGSSSCSAIFNSAFNRIEVTGVIAPDYQAPPDALPDQLVNEIKVTLLTGNAQEGFVNYDNLGEGCWDYNNNGSAQDDYGQQCIPVTAQVTSGPVSIVPIPTMTFWVKLLTMILLMLSGMTVLYFRQHRR